MGGIHDAVTAFAGKLVYACGGSVQRVWSSIRTQMPCSVVAGHMGPNGTLFTLLTIILACLQDNATGMAGNIASMGNSLRQEAVLIGGALTQLSSQGTSALPGLESSFVQQGQLLLAYTQVRHQEYFLLLPKFFPSSSSS